MRDIDYFSEDKMSSYTMTKFAFSLPVHLREALIKSLNSSRIINRSLPDRLIMGVLQGYRGPESLCNGSSGDSGELNSTDGLQEIRFWNGTSKLLNLAPIYGTLVFCLGRMAGDTAWHSLYFDSNTGEFLGTTKQEAHNKKFENRNNEAEILNQQGIKLYSEGKYKEAAAKQEQAYQKCTSGYKAEQIFKENATQAKAQALNVEGNKFYSQNNYTEAIKKYQEAYNLCPSSKTADRETFKNNIQNAQGENEAMSINTEAQQLFDQGCYQEASDKYQLACDRSCAANNLARYKSNKEKTLLVINTMKQAASLLDKAWKAENDESEDKSQEAETLFKSALEKYQHIKTLVPRDVTVQKFIDKCTAKITGNSNFNKGIELQAKGDELLQAALQLKINNDYQASKEKLEAAKSKFSIALECFIKGRELDAKFTPCIQLTEEQITHVNELLEYISHREDNNLAKAFSHLTINHDVQEQSYEFDLNLVGCNQEQNYYQHI